MIKYNGNPDEIIDGIEKWRYDLVVWRGLYGAAGISKARTARILKCSHTTVYRLIKSHSLAVTADGMVSSRSIFDYLVETARREHGKH